MDFLVLSPPVTTPSEPPSGAFLLAAGLKGHGCDARLLDLSLAFFHDLFRDAAEPPRRAVAYLQAADGYAPDRHRSETGHLHGLVSRFDEAHPGWKLTLMDVAPPGRVHQPSRIAAALAREGSPFRPTYDRVLEPVLSGQRPDIVLISVAYLSQLPAAIDLARYLEERGCRFRVGGSLINSLATTGHGYRAVAAVLPHLTVGDGRDLLPGPAAPPLLSKLSWPTMVLDAPYLSCRPVVPLTLSTGCFWNRCLFCPDREMPYQPVPIRALDDFIASIPRTVACRGAVIHLLDSAMPPGRLRRFSAVVQGRGLGFFGFARPTGQLLKGGLLRQAADAGCLMLQLGVEGGSKALLDRFQKGIDPSLSADVVREAAMCGIRTYVYLLFGLPGERPSDLLATRNFLVENGAYIDFLNLSLFNLPRYCELMDNRAAFDIEVGDFSDDDDIESIRLYRPFVSGGEDPRRQARQFLKALKGDPVVRQAHLRTPRWFRAAHLALMRIPGRRWPWTAP